MKTFGSVNAALDATPVAMNAAGDMVGTSGNGAFLYKGGVSYDLGHVLAYQTALPFQSGWTLTRVTGLSSSGAIVGRCLYNGLAASFLLLPV